MEAKAMKIFMGSMPGDFTWAAQLLDGDTIIRHQDCRNEEEAKAVANEWNQEG